MTSTELENYRHAVEAVRAMLADGTPLAAALRAEWQRLGPATGRGGIVRVDRLAHDLGANAGTVATTLQRLRREQRQAARQQAPAKPREQPAPTADQANQANAENPEKKQSLADRLRAKKETEGETSGESALQRRRREQAEMAKRYGKIDED